MGVGRWFEEHAELVDDREWWSRRDMATMRYELGVKDLAESGYNLSDVEDFITNPEWSECWKDGYKVQEVEVKCKGQDYSIRITLTGLPCERDEYHERLAASF